MHYFGQLHKLLNGLGRITVFARLLREGNQWLRDDSFDIKDIGPTGKVFLHIPVDHLYLPDKTLVSFDIEKSHKPVDAPDKDPYIVAKKSDGQTFAISKFGAFIIEKCHIDDWVSDDKRNILSSYGNLLATDSVVYVYDKQENTLIGPWRTIKNQSHYRLNPQKNQLYIYPRDEINPLTIVQGHDGGIQEYILPNPLQDIAIVVHPVLSDIKEQAAWLINRIQNNIAVHLLDYLNKEVPDWKTRFIVIYSI